MTIPLSKVSPNPYGRLTNTHTHVRNENKKEIPTPRQFALRCSQTLLSPHTRYISLSLHPLFTFNVLKILVVLSLWCWDRISVDYVPVEIEKQDVLKSTLRCRSWIIRFRLSIVSTVNLGSRDGRTGGPLGMGTEERGRPFLSLPWASGRVRVGVPPQNPNNGPLYIDKVGDLGRTDRSSP